MNRKELSIHMINADLASVNGRLSGICVQFAFSVQEDRVEKMQRTLMAAGTDTSLGILSFMEKIRHKTFKIYILGDGNHSSIFSNEFINLDIDQLMCRTFHDYANYVVVSEYFPEEYFRIQLFYASERVAAMYLDSKRSSNIDNSIFGLPSISSVFNVSEDDIISVYNDSFNCALLNISKLLMLPINLTTSEIAKNQGKYNARLVTYKL